MTRSKTELEQFRTGPWSITIIKGKNILFRSNMGGISPLMQAINQLNSELTGAVIYDKVIGRAAAFLVLYAGLRRVYTPLISQSALQLLRLRRIPVTCLERVDRILNKSQTELCPMEKLSLDADTPEQFIRLLRRQNVTTL